MIARDESKLPRYHPHWRPKPPTYPNALAFGCLLTSGSRSGLLCVGSQTQLTPDSSRGNFVDLLQCRVSVTPGFPVSFRSSTFLCRSFVYCTIIPLGEKHVKRMDAQSQNPYCIISLARKGFYFGNVHLLSRNSYACPSL